MVTMVLVTPDSKVAGRAMSVAKAGKAARATVKALVEVWCRQTSNRLACEPL